MKKNLLKTAFGDQSQELQAETIFNLAMSSQDPTEIYNLACILCQSGFEDKATPLFNKSARLGCPEASVELGKYAIAAGSSKQAYAHIQQAASRSRNPYLKALLAGLTYLGVGCKKDEHQAQLILCQATEGHTAEVKDSGDTGMHDNEENNK